MKIVHLTPIYRPAIGGIADYVDTICKHQEACGEHPHILIWSSRSEVECNHSTSVLTVPTSKALRERLSEIESRCLILHFSGYGFAKRGLCFSLVKGLTEWVKAQEDRMIISIFHEVYATGPLWKSAFWTIVPQRYIAHRLTKISVVSLATSAHGSMQLQSISPGKSFEILPVFSSVGEPHLVSNLSTRSNQAVVFGSAASRRRFYKSAKRIDSSLMQGLERLGITEIIDVGPGLVAPATLSRCPVRILGTLANTEISELLGESMLGFIDYHDSAITKSTIAAAYFSHGLLVVNTSGSSIAGQIHQASPHFLPATVFASEPFHAQQIATNGFLWYQFHRSEIIAKRISSKIRHHEEGSNDSNL